MAQINKRATNITWLTDPEYVDTQFSGSLDSAASFKEYFNFIETKLKLAKRSLEYWDIYRFKSSLNDPDLFASAFAALEPNTSLIINCKNFNYNGVDYHQGDVVIKKDDGSSLHIKALESGLFYPASLTTTDNNINVLTYKYATSTAEVKTQSQASDGIKYSETNGVLQSNAVEIGLDEPSNIYGIKPTINRNNGSATFDAIADIHPIVKLFTEDGEEVYASIQVVLNAAKTQYTISGIPSVVTQVMVK